ncbi:MAG TPA: NifU family protein [Solirubrobacterales bacterium]|nr:NifU family protein [Solirubrobacterales bacterium]
MDFDKAVAELEALVETLEREGDERALLLLQLVDAIHRPALERIAAGDTSDPIAQALLQMYDIAPPDDDVLVEEALDEVRPYIHSHGGEVELLGVTDGVVELRMSGSCAGCAASAMTLKRGVEEALRNHYPGFREVVAEEVEKQAGPQLLQIENLHKPVFLDAEAAAELGPGELMATELDGIQLLLANFEGEIYALRDGCPIDGNSLGGARLTAEGVIVCPWHNCAYDVRTGARVDGEEGGGLGVIPVAMRNGTVQVAVNVA